MLILGGFSLQHGGYFFGTCRPRYKWGAEVTCEAFDKGKEGVVGGEVRAWAVVTSKALSLNNPQTLNPKTQPNRLRCLQP